MDVIAIRDGFLYVFYSFNFMPIGVVVNDTNKSKILLFDSIPISATRVFDDWLYC